MTADWAQIRAAHFKDDSELLNNVFKWTIAFVVAMKCTLRREQEIEHFAEISDLLTEEELLEMMSAAHKPSYVSLRISSHIAEKARRIA